MSDLDNHTENALSKPTASVVNAYRTAFWLLLVLFGCSAIVVATFWWRLRPPQKKPSDGSQQITSSENAGLFTNSPPPTEIPIVPIQLTPQRMQSIGVKVGMVESKVVSDSIRFYGAVQVNERKQAYIQPRFAGWIRQVHLNATGDFVRKGDPLFSIYSPEIVATEEEYLLAKKNAASLSKSSVEGVAGGAESLVNAARDRLLQWDVPASEISNLDLSGKVSMEITIQSPVTGFIAEKNILPNMYVQPENKLYSVADLSDVWVLAQVFQNDAGKIKPGDQADVSVDAFPSQVFHGRVDYLLPQIDTATRTLPVRIVLQNPGLKLRPGMYVNVNVKLSLGRSLVVPESAIFHSGTKNLVFIYEEGGKIQPREVELGSLVDDQWVVTKGVKKGEKIIASANFLIDSEAQLQAAAETFAPPPPGAGQAASMNAPQQQANIDLTTAPSPPQKGSNKVRLRITDSTGKPIVGAAITVTFFMAAMPAMNMAAMKTVITPEDKGSGYYEGTGQLASGGTWQVTVTAQQNGQPVASKQLTLVATGGM